MYLALNGPSYTGNGPNVIKEFRPASVDDVNRLARRRGMDVFPNPATSLVTVGGERLLDECQLPRWSTWQGNVAGPGSTLGSTANWMCHVEQRVVHLGSLNLKMHSHDAWEAHVTQ